MGVGRFDGVVDEQVLAAYADPALPRHEREAAFSEIVGRYQRRVYAVCYRFFGNHADAEDAAQDTFLQLARRAGQFRCDAKLSTFVYRVATNACNDSYRKQARRPQTPVADVAVAARDAADVVDDIAGRELALEIETALLRLDDLSRTIIVLTALEGLSYAEVSSALDLPVGTIKSRVFRARAQLARLLDPGDGGVGTGVPPADRAVARRDRNREPPARAPPA